MYMSKSLFHKYVQYTESSESWQIKKGMIIYFPTYLAAAKFPTKQSSSTALVPDLSTACHWRWRVPPNSGVMCSNSLPLYPDTGPFLPVQNYPTLEL